MAFRREAHAEDRNLTLSWDSWGLKSRDSEIRDSTTCEHKVQGVSPRNT